MPELEFLSRLKLDGIERPLKDPNAVSFMQSQNLTEEQKATARNNIGAGAASYDAITSDEIISGTDTDSKVVRADYLNTAINSMIDTKIDTAITQVLAASY